MRKSVQLLTLFAAFAAMGFSETWRGRLVDASCYDQQNGVQGQNQSTQNGTRGNQMNAGGMCNPTSSTTAFELVVSNVAYKLNDSGNSKAAEAIRSTADRPANPSQPASTNNRINATVTGTKEGQTIKVDRISIQ